MKLKLLALASALAALAHFPVAAQDRSPSSLQQAPEAATGYAEKAGWAARKYMVAAANPTPAAVYSRQDKSMVPATSTSTTVASRAKVSDAPPVVRLVAPANGFDWGDAGIGAAAGLALSMIGLGGALAVTRRTRHTPA